MRRLGGQPAIELGADRKWMSHPFRRSRRVSQWSVVSAKGTSRLVTRNSDWPWSSANDGQSWGLEDPSLPVRARLRECETRIWA